MSFNILRSADTGFLQQREIPEPGVENLQDLPAVACLAAPSTPDQLHCRKGIRVPRPEDGGDSCCGGL